MKPSSWGVQIKVEGKWEWVWQATDVPYTYNTRDEAYSLSYIRYPELWQQQKQDGQKYIRIKEIKNTIA